MGRKYVRRSLSDEIGSGLGGDACAGDHVALTRKLDGQKCPLNISGNCGTGGCCRGERVQ